MCTVFCNSRAVQYYIIIIYSIYIMMMYLQCYVGIIYYNDVYLLRSCRPEEVYTSISLVSTTNCIELESYIGAHE